MIRLVYFGKALTICIEYDAGTRQPQALQLRVLRELSERLIVELNDLANVDERILDALIFTELAVCRVQVAEVYPSELLDLAGHRLRIIHCGRDKLIEVDILDVKSLAHLRAPGPQELDDLSLILNRIELCFYGIRSGRNLAQGKRRSEDLDQDWIHGAVARCTFGSEYAPTPLNLD